MENELLGIGRLSALSGLPVSALRFYDGAQVLPPALVDPSSGYRYYLPSQVAPARLVAHLRRVGLSLEDIRTALAEPGQAASILDAHLSRLEAGLADARREISMARQLLNNPEIEMLTCTAPCTLSAAELIRALREVRFAVSEDPEQPRLCGVLIESEPGQIRLVATDRYRLATSTLPTSTETSLHLLLPTAAVDELLAAGFTGTLNVVAEDGILTVSGNAGTVRAEAPGLDFPSYRSLLGAGRREVAIDAERLRDQLVAGPTQTFTRDNDGATYLVSQLSVTVDGVEVGAADDPDAVVVAVNREYLLQALSVGGQLTLGLDDPIAPIAIRQGQGSEAMSILMPVRLG